MSERKKILWLVSWYPNKYDPFDGDFIQRHARAAALHHDVHVLFVKQAIEQRSPERTSVESNGLTEEIIYLPKRQGPVGKLQNLLHWYAAGKSHTRRLLSSSQPALIHVHIPWRSGLFALWARRRHRIPYFVTEHWGIYNRFVDDNLFRRPVWMRYGLKRIYRKATRFLSVSRFLGEAVNNTLLKKSFAVVPNVVDTALFYPSSVKNHRFTFLHVSNMVPLKNISGLLQSFHDFLLTTNGDVQLILVGRTEERYVSLAAQLGLLNQSVFFRGEVTYAEVAVEMQQAHVFVLNSNLENSPCVLGEALCCGLPVIATKVGGVPELVSEFNGVLVSPQSPAELSGAMSQLYSNYKQYHPDQIAVTAAGRFSMAAVGALFSKYYTAQHKPHSFAARK